MIVNPTQRKPSNGGSPGGATRASKLAETLREAILRGELAPGTRLSLDALRKRYQVSLSPLREAISRLASTGLVVTQDQRGHRVAPVSLPALLEICALRDCLEPRGLRESMRHTDLDWQSEVRAARHRVQRAFPGDQPGLSDIQAAALDSFHVTLIANAQMPILKALSRNMHDHWLRYLHLFGGAMTQDMSIPNALSSIADEAISGDADTACARLSAEIARTGTRLKAQLPVE